MEFGLLRAACIYGGVVRVSEERCLLQIEAVRAGLDVGRDPSLMRLAFVFT